DRRFQDTDLGEYDRHLLDLFAHQAGIIFELHRLRRRIGRAEEDLVWKTVAMFMKHDIGNPFNAIQYNFNLLHPPTEEPAPAAAGAGTSWADEVVGRIRRSLGQARVYLDHFKTLADVEAIKLGPISLLPLLGEVRKEAADRGTPIDVACTPEDLS